SAAEGGNQRRRRRRRAGLVPRRDVDRAALQIYGRRLHALAEGQARQAMIVTARREGRASPFGWMQGRGLMFDRTLTERLEAATADRPYRAAPFDKSVLVDSVLSNMRRILNERRGSCETRGDYGIPDLNDVLGHGGTPSELAQIVQEMIRAFEPRLSDPV